jgi:peptidyl-tRNA hydrolase
MNWPALGSLWRRVSHWRGELAEARRDAVGGAGAEPGTIRLLKPLTYMNLSGEAVRPCADFFRIRTRADSGDQR